VIDDMAQALCENILARARQFDDGAEIASVRRTEADGAMRVRLLASKADAPGMLQALRSAWPLASVSQVENLANGRTETQVLLPDEAEQQEIARSIAARAPWQAPLRAAVRGLVVLLAAACVQKAVQISSG
tara:strand:- start:277 stop:669 length:393 start_codon:yes stop_codon:yes gene_type:complete